MFLSSSFQFVLSLQLWPCVGIGKHFWPVVGGSNCVCPQVVIRSPPPLALCLGTGSSADQFEVSLG